MVVKSLRSIALGILVAAWCTTSLAAPPSAIVELAREMCENGADVQAGSTPELGVFVVGIGRVPMGENLDQTREAARLGAVHAISAFVGTSFSGSSTVEERASVSQGNAEVESFFTKRSQSEAKAFLGGIQTLSARRNEHGSMEVVAYTAQRSPQVAEAQRVLAQASELQGAVIATGYGTDRAAAEKRALASAVDQVVGTMIIGKTAVNERMELTAKLSSSAQGLVESYRVVRETHEEQQFCVVVAAKVSKRKVYENYRAYFKHLDNPVFYLRASDADLANAFEQYFLDKGVRLTRNLASAHYIISVDGQYTLRPSPITGAPGVVLSARVEVCSRDGQRVLMSLPPQRAAKDSRVLTLAQMTEEVSQRVFGKLKPALDEAFHKMVVTLLDDAQ